jgi:hypothetical protein
LDIFEFYFGFYSLILGLAVAELLNGFANLIRERQLSRLGPNTALLAVFILISIAATWLDAWRTRHAIELDFSDLALPSLTAISYYLAAAIVFPKTPAEWTSLDDYYDGRKRFVIGLLLFVEVAIGIMNLGVAEEMAASDMFSYWRGVAHTLAVQGLMIALIILKGRLKNAIMLAALILLFLALYWLPR